MNRKENSIPAIYAGSCKKIMEDKTTIGNITSEKGFYIGDVCYVLADDLYYRFWGDTCNFEDGCITDPDTGFQFAVAGTAYGDGCYADNYGNIYGVDAGVIGLVPLELVKDSDTDSDGLVIREPGSAHFEASGGKFKITLPSGKVFLIDTAK